METIVFTTSEIPCLVSVVVPVHTGLVYLPEAIRSIEQQSYRNLEIILVNDSSGEDLHSCLDEVVVPACIYSLPVKSGVAAARNFGVSNARGEFIAFLDADDLWESEHISRRVELLKREPEALGSRGLTSSFYSHNDGTRTPIARNFTPFHVGATVFRRCIFERVGGFDERLELSSDADYFFRCQHLAIPFVDDSEVSLYYRKSNCTLSRSPDDPKKMLRGLAQALRAKGLREGLI